MASVRAKPAVDPIEMCGQGARSLLGLRPTGAVAPPPAFATVEPMNDAVLYRDHEYGALALLRVRGGLEVLDHRFHAPHLDRALGVLERHGRPGEGNLWRLHTHTEAVLSSVEAALSSCGYTYSSHAARAILLVPESVAKQPDTPSERRTSISESVGRWVGDHLSIIEAILGCTFAVTAFQRASRLPFLRARAVCADETCVARALAILDPLGKAVVRVSHDAGVLEVAIAPSREQVALCESRALPTFGGTEVIGVREATFCIDVDSMDEESFLRLKDRARRCAATTRLERRGRAIVATVPTAHLGGDPSCDPAFRARAAWLVVQLAEWEPTLDDVSDARPIGDRRVSRDEADETLLAAEQHAAANPMDVVARRAYYAALVAAGKLVDPSADAPKRSDVPVGLDADAIRDVCSHIAGGQDIDIRRKEAGVVSRLLQRMMAGTYDRAHGSTVYTYIVDEALTVLGPLALTSEERRFLAQWFARRFEARFGVSSY